MVQTIQSNMSTVGAVVDARKVGTLVEFTNQSFKNMDVSVCVSCLKVLCKST